MQILEILYEMSTNEAMRLFARLGYDIPSMSPGEIKQARNELMKRYHPDLTGGSSALAANINVAYTLLKNYQPNNYR